MSDSIFLGKAYESLKKRKRSDAYSKVVIITGEKDENDKDIAYSAGNDTGLTLEIENPYGTQAMANSLLNTIRGFRYQAYDLTNGLLDPAAEIGDGITAGSVYSGIFSLNQDYGLLLTSDIGAKRSDEEDEEYDYVPKSSRSLSRELSKIQTSFTIKQGLIEARIDADEVWLEGVEGDVDGLSDSVDQRFTDVQTTLSVQAGQIASKITSSQAETLIQQDLSRITLSVSNGGQSSTLTLKNGSTTLSSPVIRISGFVEFTDLSGAGRTTINGANITTGTILADRIATNISQVNNYLTLGTTGQSGRLIFPPASSSAAGNGAYIEHTQYYLDICALQNLRLNSDFATYINSSDGLILQSSHNTSGGTKYNVIWGTADPATRFANAGLNPPETGQIYFQIS